VPWLLDLDGVIWLGDEPIPGAAEAVTRLRDAGERVVFVTNNSNAPVATVEAKLEAHGIEATGDVVTSATAAAGLVHAGERVLICGGDGVREALRSVGAVGVEVGDLADDKVDAVLVGFHEEFDYDRMRTAARAVRAGARLIATNDDATYPTRDGPIPGAGSILAGIEKASGHRAVVAGKPYEPMADYLRARLGPDGLVVGDRPDTDGRLAAVLGWRFALVLTGVTTAEDLPVTPAPDVIARDLRAVVESQ